MGKKLPAAETRSGRCVSAAKQDYSADVIVVNAVLIWPPSVLTVPMMTAAINATSKPYSTPAAPRSSAATCLAYAAFCALTANY